MRPLAESRKYRLPPTPRHHPAQRRAHPGGADAKLNAWIEAQPEPKPSRSEAIRQLLERALNAAALR